jgi:hypothetical protein
MNQIKRMLVSNEYVAFDPISKSPCPPLKKGELKLTRIRHEVKIATTMKLAV